MKTLVAFVVVLVSFSSVGGHIIDGPNAKDILVQAVSDLNAAKQLDLRLMGRIMDLQLKIGDRGNAFVTYQLYSSRLPPGGGGFGRPGLYEFTQSLIKTREPVEFKSLIEFVESTEKELAKKTTTVEVVGVDGTREVPLRATKWIDQMKVNMVAIAASKQQFKLAEEILDSMSVPVISASPADITIGKNETIEAGKQLAYYLVTNEKVSDALRVASRFENLVARAEIGVAIYKHSKHNENVKTQIDQLLAKTDSSAASLWVREKLNAAIKNKDADTAAELLAQLKAAGVNTDYLASKVGKLLLANGETELANELLALTQKTIKSKPVSPRTRLTAERQLAKQYVAMGDIDKVIEICGHWTVDIEKSVHRRRMTRQVQPLSRLALEYAKKGKMEDAERATNAIADDFWRADTLAEIARLISRKNKETGSKKYDEVLKLAKEITDDALRNHVVGKVVMSRINDEMSFEELLEQLDLIEDKGKKANILGESLEFRIKKGMPMEQIQEAIKIIVDGDSMGLSHVVDALVARKEFEAAGEAVLQIKLEPEFEFILHKLMTKVVKQWDVQQQLKFVSKATESEQANLLKIVLDNAPEDSKQVVRDAALDNLTNHSFCQPLYEDLMRHYVKTEDLESMSVLVEAPLDRNQYVAASVFQDSIKKRLVEICHHRIKESGQQSVLLFEKNLKPDWAREAISYSQIKAHIDSGQFKLAVERASAVKDPGQRARMRYLIASQIFDAM